MYKYKVIEYAQLGNRKPKEAHLVITQIHLADSNMASWPDDNCMATPIIYGSAA